MILSSACRFNPSYQGPGTAYLQGEWKQDSAISEKQLVNYTLYHFTFNCDSFFVRMENFSKVNYGADTCMKNGHWFEYSKGSYQMRGDTLHLKGFYANANYSLKDPGGCFNSGVYEDNFKVSKQGDSALNLQPLGNTIAVKVKLVKRLTCVPKPL
ncbi:fumarate hydratase [Mucilaginibacter sp. AW1-3]